MSGEPRTLLIRADADEGRGAGHVMRSLALACAWRSQGGSVDFLSSRPLLYFRQKIQEAGVNLIQIDHHYPDQEDLHTTIRNVDKVAREGQQRPWIVIDGYHFDTEYQAALRAASARVLVVDDTAHLVFYDADCILNHGLQAPQLEYRCAPDCIRLFGPKYALLRPEFISAAKPGTATTPIAKRILVTMGGSDSDNVTEKVVEALKLLDSPFEARVIAGFMYPHISSLRRATAAFGDRIAVETAVYDLAESMLWADIALNAAGGTCWELAALGVPMITLIAAENQKLIGAELEKAGAAVCLGWHRNVSTADIAKSIDQLVRAPFRREQMKRRGKTLVDGAGAQRVVDVLNKQFNTNAA